MAATTVWHSESLGGVTGRGVLSPTYGSKRFAQISTWSEFDIAIIMAA